MVTSHVTYACQCLNIKVHLANKYYLDGHQKFRKENFIRLNDLPISGWQFELSMNGVEVEYASLIRSTRNSSKHGDWITFSCQNCNTGDVYSIKQSTEEDEDEQEMRKKFDTIHCHRYKDQEGQISTKQKTTSPLSDLDQPIVIIHTGTVFGAEIDRIKEKSNFSHTFHIVLKPDLPGSQISLEEHNGAEEDSELRAQHRQIQHLLKESLVDMEMATKNRVEAYKAEQEMLLRRAKEKAMYDGAILWQTIKEATRTVRDKERTRYLSLSQQQFLSQKLKNNNSMSDSALMNVLKENMIQQLPSPSSSRRSSLAALGRRTSLFNIDRATSTYSNGVTSGGPQNTTMIRRSSCILNESTITNSLRRGDGTSDIVNSVQQQQQRQSELTMPQFYRRRSSLAPISTIPTTPTTSNSTANNPRDITTTTTQPSTYIFNNDFVHPLAQQPITAAERLEPQPELTEQEGLFQVTTINAFQKEDDKEHVFSLDEEHPKRKHEFLNGSIKKDELRGKPSVNKYIDSDDEEDEENDKEESEEEDVDKVASSEHDLDEPAEEQASRFATSVPINIQGLQRQNSFSSLHLSASSSLSSYRQPDAPTITVDTEKLSFTTLSLPRFGHSFKEQREQLQQQKQPTNNDKEQQQGNQARRRSSIFGIDHTAEADRRASLKIITSTECNERGDDNLPPHLRERNGKRRFSSNLNFGTASTTAALHNQPHYYTHYKDTQQRGRRRSSKIGKSQRYDSDDEGTTEPFIPPHILAANTYIDETEALFGSIPRHGTRYRPLE